MHRRLRRVVLLQQAILEHSDIHRDETAVFHEASALCRAYEMIGGALHSPTRSRSSSFRFLNTPTPTSIIAEPVLNFDVDEVFAVLSAKYLWR